MRRKEGCALGTGRRELLSYAAMKGAQTLSSKEESALSMVPSSSLLFAVAKDAPTKSSKKISAVAGMTKLRSPKKKTFRLTKFQFLFQQKQKARHLKTERKLLLNAALRGALIMQKRAEYVAGTGGSHFAVMKGVPTKYERLAFAFVTVNLKNVNFAVLRDAAVKHRRGESASDMVQKSKSAATMGAPTLPRKEGSVLAMANN